MRLQLRMQPRAFSDEDQGLVGKRIGERETC
jgi:hypothetical protein